MEHVVHMACIAAREFHEGQKYGDHDYYTYHLHGVANVALHQHDGQVRLDWLHATALLHDIIEDTPCSVQTLIDFAFPQPIIDAVVLLTKEEGYKPVEYLKRVKAKPLARAVKIADAHFNLSNSLMEHDEAARRRVIKYLDYIAYLK